MANVGRDAGCVCGDVVWARTQELPPAGVLERLVIPPFSIQQLDRREMKLKPFRRRSFRRRQPVGNAIQRLRRAIHLGCEPGEQLDRPSIGKVGIVGKRLEDPPCLLGETVPLKRPMRTL